MGRVLVSQRGILVIDCDADPTTDLYHPCVSSQEATHSLCFIAIRVMHRCRLSSKTKIIQRLN